MAKENLNGINVGDKLVCEYKEGLIHGKCPVTVKSIDGDIITVDGKDYLKDKRFRVCDGHYADGEQNVYVRRTDEAELREISVAGEIQKCIGDLVHDVDRISTAYVRGKIDLEGIRKIASEVRSYADDVYNRE